MKHTSFQEINTIVNITKNYKDKISMKYKYALYFQNDPKKFNNNEKTPWPNHSVVFLYDNAHVMAV